MNKRRWLLYVFERAYEPTRQAEERLQRSIHDKVPDGRASRALLAQLEAPDTLSEQRLVARIVDIPSAEPRRSAMPWGLTAGRLALACTGVAGLAIAVVFGPGDTTPEQLDTHLVQQAEPIDLAPMPGVRLAYQGGYGELGGTTRSPEIDWISGELAVEVEPNRGIQLSVHTQEATVRVVGTRFTVNREDAHTVVAVQRGKVEVTCADGEQVMLTNYQQHACESRSPSRLVFRAARLRDRGAAPDKVLGVVERGLGLAAEGEAAWSHLQVLRMLTLADMGDEAQALEAATSYLDAEHARRRDEVLRLAMDLSEEPCGLAMEHSAMLQADNAPPADLVTLSDCLANDQPERARALLERAMLAPGLEPRERAWVHRRMSDLQ